MNEPDDKTISPRRYRTRRDILEAASRVVKTGGTPSMENIAAEAMVSRATVYRYFSDVETLLIEASIDIETPDPDTFFNDNKSLDPADRLDRIEAALHKVMYDNEQVMRQMLAGYLTHKQNKGEEKQQSPLRQNRRTKMIQAALAPAQSQLDPCEYDNLCASLALVFGLESMIVFQDVLPISSRKARTIKRWMIDALVDKAMKK